MSYLPCSFAFIVAKVAVSMATKYQVRCVEDIYIYTYMHCFRTMRITFTSKKKCFGSQRSWFDSCLMFLSCIVSSTNNNCKLHKLVGMEVIHSIIQFVCFLYLPCQADHSCTESEACRQSARYGWHSCFQNFTLVPEVFFRREDTRQERKEAVKKPSGCLQQLIDLTTPIDLN